MCEGTSSTTPSEPVASTPLDDTSASNDWRTEMAIGRSNDPMRTAPAPIVSDEPDQRVVSMTWEHDWLGNMQSWDDDSAVFYERSLGEIVNGADLPSEMEIPEMARSECARWLKPG